MTGESGRPCSASSPSREALTEVAELRAALGRADWFLTAWLQGCALETFMFAADGSNAVQAAHAEAKRLLGDAGAADFRSLDAVIDMLAALAPSPRAQATDPRGSGTPGGEASTEAARLDGFLLGQWRMRDRAQAEAMHAAHCGGRPPTQYVAKQISASIGDLESETTLPTLAVPDAGVEPVEPERTGGEGL